jgi:hypothetical protein
MEPAAHECLRVEKSDGIHHGLEEKAIGMPTRVPEGLLNYEDGIEAERVEGRPARPRNGAGMLNCNEFTA